MDRQISPSPVNDNALLNLPLCSLDTLSWPQHIYLPIRGSRLGRRKHSVTFEAFQRLKRTSLFSTSLKASPLFFFSLFFFLSLSQWNVISRRWCHAMEHSWGGEQISKWTRMSSRNSPSLHHQQSRSHGPGKFDWSSIELFFCTLSFQQDALTSCLIIKHYCLPSHISGLWWLMILPPDLGKSQVVSMCLKLATPRTSGGLNQTRGIKVRKMKRRSLQRT